MKKTIISLFILISIVLCSCSQKQEETPYTAKGIPVVVDTPTIKDVTVYLETIGSLHPSIFHEIHPETQGILQEIFVKEGDWVQPGTPIFSIDPKSYSIKVQEAQAQLTIDKAQLKAVQKKLERFQSLAQKDLIAQTEWDDLEAQAERALGSVQLDEARLESAEINLSKCMICSPITGRVGSIDAHRGLLIDAGYTTPLTSVSQMDPLIVEFSITEKEFSKVPREGLKFEMSMLCSSEECQSGEVSFMDNHFDAKTGLLIVRGKVDNKNYFFRPGQSVRVKVPVQVIHNAMVIPQKAIRYNQEGPYAYVVKEDMTVALRQLTLGIELGENQLVNDGLEPNEKVILDGHLRLFPGTMVEIQS